MAMFKIYSASAGAGKTYQLVRDFLRISLGTSNSAQFMRILAVTFTNKAANEMKVRIVDQLKELASPDINHSGSMLQDLCEDLDLTASEVSQRAASCLSTILHEYSAFAVSTIDGFTNRLIRSFARDLQVSSSYEVEMENDEMLQEAIDEMLSRLTEKSDTTDIILGFVEEQLEEGRSPRPEHSLMEAGRNLFREEAFPHLRSLRQFKPSQFKSLISELKATKRGIEKEVEAMAAEILHFLELHGLAKEHFSRGYLFNYFTQIANGQTDKWVPKISVQKVVNGEDNFYAKGKSKEYAPLFAPIEQELHDRLLRLVSCIEENYGRYHLTSSVLRNIYGTAVITEIDRQLQKVKEDTNRLPIGEFNKLIGEKLAQEPAEYMFERLGERYRFFFVDEFQDTSRLQWQNLLPLVNNAMASGGEAMLVGDAKQSIYRWRGGEVEQFLDLKNDKDLSNKLKSGDQLIELYQRISHSLPKNYRSKANVVAFNNEFFSLAATLLEGEGFAEIYNNSAQEIQHGQGGYVELNLLAYDSQNKEAYIAEQCAHCEAVILDALKRSYDYGDVTILVRSNSKGSLIAQYLLKQGIPVISPDALALESSREVLALISGLEMLNQNYQKSVRFHFMDYLSDKPEVKSQYPEKHPFIAKFCNAQPESLFPALSSLLQDFKLSELMLLSLSDLVYQLSHCLGINIQTDPFMHAFIDQLRGFEIRDGEDLPGFLRWWHERGHKINISTPENSNAVQVMSIHKSKGLEFKVCILAFADWPTEREPGSTRKWLEIDPEAGINIPSAWINLSKDDSGLTFPSYQQLYDVNKALVNFDNINLLYVAFTRAIDELYIFGGDGLIQPNQRAYRYLKAYLDTQGEETFFSQGEKSVQKPKSTAADQPYLEFETSSWKDRLMVIAEAPKQWSGGEISTEVARGKMLHGLLAEIVGAADVDPTLERHRKDGNLTSTEATELRVLLRQVVEHPALSDLFSEKVDVLNEAEVLEPGGQTSRPDRVILLNGRTDMIDYKTGAMRPEHREQMTGYRRLLNDMGYPSGNNILAYIGEEIKIDQWQSN